MNRFRAILYPGATLATAASVSAAVRHGDAFSVTACALSTTVMVACIAVYEIRTRRG